MTFFRQVFVSDSLSFWSLSFFVCFLAAFSASRTEKPRPRQIIGFECPVLNYTRLFLFSADNEYLTQLMPLSVDRPNRQEAVDFTNEERK